MKTSIASFSSHDEAMAALVKLKAHHYTMNRVSLIGKAEILEDKIHIRSNDAAIAAPVVAGTVLGTILGALSGISLITIPGFGFLFGAGALIGAIAGFDFGVVTGGVTSLLMQLGLKEDYAIKYREQINDGKFLMFINGTEKEIEDARKIIGDHYSGYDVHEPIILPGKSTQAA